MMNGPFLMSRCNMYKQSPHKNPVDDKTVKRT